MSKSSEGISISGIDKFVVILITTIFVVGYILLILKVFNQ